MNIVGTMVCGPNEADRYLDRTLESVLPLVDEMVVVANNCDEKTLEMLEENKCHIIQDDREWGKHQHHIKNDMISQLDEFDPDWVLTVDADEVFEERVTREVLEDLASGNDIGWYFWFIELWDDEEHHRLDWAFEKCVYYKWMGAKPVANKALHCGNVPKTYAKWGSHSEYFILHYGLMNPEDRKRKYDRYKKYDPNGRYLSKGWYNGLVDTSEAEIVELDWEELYKETKTHRRSKVPIINQKKTMAKEYIVENPHGAHVIIPERHLEQTISREGFQLISEVGAGEAEVEVEMPDDLPGEYEEEEAQEEEEEVEEEQVEEDVDEIHVCDLCGKTSPTEHGIKTHKGLAH